MASASAIPETLKQAKPYITLATQLDQRNEKFVAYYCKLYALQLAMSINKSSPDCKKFLLQLMDELEAIKAQNKGEEAIQSQLVGQAYVEKLALSIFQKADAEDRGSMFSKNLVKQFYSSGLLFDTLNYFGDLSEDLVVKKQYAKRKAMYLNRCFQTGEKPIPGPLIEDGSDELNQKDNDEGQNENESRFNQPTDHNQYNKPDEFQPSPKPRMNNTPNQVPEASYYHTQETTEMNSPSLTPEQFLQAQKLCKFANSALQYEDVPTAITNLEKCLSILKTGK